MIAILEMGSTGVALQPRAASLLAETIRVLQVSPEERQQWQSLRLTSRAEFDRLSDLSSEDLQAERGQSIQLVGTCWGDVAMTFFLSACDTGPITGSGFNKYGPFAVTGEWAEEDGGVSLVVTNRHGAFELRMHGDTASSTLVGVAEGNEGEVTLRVAGE